MELLLSRFQEEIHPTWLEAAQALLPELGPLEWPWEGTVRAEVHAEEIFEVFLDLEGDQVLGYSCTCDNEAPICLHTIALLLAVAAEEEL